MPKLIDLKNRVVGQLKVLYYAGVRYFPGGGCQTYWRCLCQGCGRTGNYSARHLRDGQTKRCNDCRLKAVTVPKEQRRCKWCGRRTNKKRDNKAKECHACERQASPSRAGRYPCCGAPRVAKRFLEKHVHRCGERRVLDHRATERAS